MKYWKLVKILMKTENTVSKLRRINDTKNSLHIDLEILASKIAKNWFGEKTEVPDSWDKAKVFKDSKKYDLKI